MKRIKARIISYIVNIVIGNIVVGGHCGCCGGWVAECLVFTDWRWTVCDECGKSETNEGGNQEG